MKALKFIFIYLFLVLTLSSCMQPRQDFSTAVTRFHKQTKGTTALFFYPAVIGVLNFTHDSTFAAATKNIHKIEIVKLSKDSIPRSLADSLIDGVKSEKFHSLMEMYRDGSQINLFARTRNDQADHFVAVVYSPKNMVVVDLLGEIPLKYLPALLSNNISLSGFETVLNAKPDFHHRNHDKQKPKQKPKDGKHTRDK